MSEGSKAISMFYLTEKHLKYAHVFKHSETNIYACMDQNKQ